ncbi:MAG: hypothetical protein DHS20C18_40620 [Saprospiraceae bacterium]|nr:MAG: hypothetical protein DHS20C18_40620 [Saprospiraceae bacterium]
MNKIILVGTSKGLVVYRHVENKWRIETTQFVGFPVSMVYVDERHGTWWVCLTHRHWGLKLHRSSDQGKSWEALPVPKYPEDAQLQSGQPATLRKIWTMQQAGPDRPTGLYLGTEPGGLFFSNNGGDSFELVESLWNHPSRKDQWFGAGRDHPFIHSIVVDPRNSNHLYVAVSCAGVFETMDGGNSWQARNNGLVAAYLPNPQAEIGHDPHRMFACAMQPDILWQQNHCGIYRSTDGGRQWTDIAGVNNFPNYGFAIAIDHRNPQRAWVIPAVSDEIRVAVNLALCVCRTEDGGQTWQELRQGLPQENCFDIVFRHAFANIDDVLVFGTTTGNLYLSENGGDQWTCLSGNLARVESICMTVG